MIYKINKWGIYFFFVLSFGISTTWAQTSIGKKQTENASVLLDFKEGDSRGIILPWITKAADVVTPVGGTLIFDTMDKKVKYFKGGTEASWIDLSTNEGAVDASVQQGVAENPTVVPSVIGSRTSSAQGVLVLESTSKAMVLPKMAAPHLNLLSPQPGTMVFDTESKMLCIFNGKEWSFWKVN